MFSLKTVCSKPRNRIPSDVDVDGLFSCTPLDTAPGKRATNLKSSHVGKHCFPYRPRVLRTTSPTPSRLREDAVLVTNRLQLPLTSDISHISIFVLPISNGSLASCNQFARVEPQQAKLCCSPISTSISTYHYQQRHPTLYKCSAATATCTLHYGPSPVTLASAADRGPNAGVVLLV